MKHTKTFEDFFPSGGDEDIFAKVFAIDQYIADNPQPALNSLGIRNLGKAEPRVVLENLDGKRIPSLMFGSNSYLSLTIHPDVVAASKAACDKYGYGMGSVSLYAGVTDLHRELEKKIALFHGCEDAIVFPGGYATNIGVVSALCGSGDVVINDSANHASIFDGCILSGAEIKIYPHGKMKFLERILKRLPDSQKGRLILTDGVFSMHGDTARLDEIADLAKRYGARIMVDDAHGLGIVGPTGRGTAEMHGCMDDIDLNVGMLSKAPGGLGGYCAASRAVVSYLRYYARTYFFSTSLPAPIVAGLIEAFRLLETDTAGRDRLWINVNYMKSKLQGMGFNTGNSESAVVPVIVEDEEKLVAFHEALRKAGLYTNIVTYPAVRRKECRIRMCIMNSFTTGDMDKALGIMEQVGKNLEII
ncbi:MAG: aminotransferase class I/II-fold pyridoxal phosphate-dependent enzyme [Bacteroidetes bacterium]|nr:aminotransferase class I/II-fold pyridoxal phosphate-dependent enzyme [Bacteroidota bacterium]